MNRSRIIRWLRVAVSAVCVVVCVGLIGLWVRSYSWVDQGHGKVPFFAEQMLTITSDRGIACIILANNPLFPFFYHATPIDKTKLSLMESHWAFRISTDGTYLQLHTPYLFLVAPSAAFAFVSWLPWWSTRFSLRTLFIVTTLVALGLGFVALVVRL